MSRVEAAAAMDRLPWLPDEPHAAPQRRRRGRGGDRWLAAVLLVGGAAFWFGAQQRRRAGSARGDARMPRQPSRCRLPGAPHPRRASRQVDRPPQPEVEPIVAAARRR